MVDERKMNPWNPADDPQASVVKRHEWTFLRRSARGTLRYRCMQCLLLRAQHANGGSHYYPVGSHYHPVDGSPPVTLCPPCMPGKRGYKGV